eukprot:SAG11_NODE_15812_length_565_cov_1.881974_2_plen_84_part_00
MAHPRSLCKRVASELLKPPAATDQAALGRTALEPRLQTVRKECLGSCMLLGEWTTGKKGSSVFGADQEQHKMRRKTCATSHFS